MDESPDPEPQDRWDDQVSRAFIDYGRYVVLERERQVQIIVNLLPRFDGPCTIVELCCGEGLLAEAILDRRSRCCSATSMLCLCPEAVSSSPTW